MKTARESSPHSGSTVRIRADVAAIGGLDFQVEDWWINVAGGSWMFATSNPAALKYAMRAGFAGLPTDDEVLYGKIAGFGELVHVSEIDTTGGAR